MDKILKEIEQKNETWTLVKIYPCTFKMHKKVNELRFKNTKNLSRYSRSILIPKCIQKYFKCIPKSQNGQMITQLNYKQNTAKIQLK